MGPKMQMAAGVAATIGLIVADELLPDGGLVLLLVAACLALVSAIGGPRLPLFLRVFATGTVFYFGYVACLMGRTMEPGLTRYTFQSALVMFGLFASLPTLSLLRIWPRRVRGLIVMSVFPVSLVAASFVAAYEEKLFIEEHAEGVGPTSRWTVSNHWLAYDAETKRLSGSD